MVVARSEEGLGVGEMCKGGLRYRLPVVKSIGHGDGEQHGDKSVALFCVFEGFQEPGS